MRSIHFFQAIGKFFLICNIVSFDQVQGSDVCLQGDTQRAFTACRALSSVYPGQIIFPNATDYTAEADGGRSHI